mmetsp:Transcript_19261/g.41926  ORF Transcript_19261/g.41926 Transcript_19261/m.41926 type:complete len:704 (-) Transcript_19261:548-2659(-)
MRDRKASRRWGSAATDSHDDDKDAPPSSQPSISKLLSLARPESVALSIALLFMVASEASGLITPLLVAQAYDALVDPSLDDDGRMSIINRAMTLVLVVHVAGMISGFIRSSIMSVAGERVVARLRNTLFGAILKQEIAYFDEHKSGELVSRLGSDTALIQQATSLAVPEIVLGVVKLWTCIGICFWISPELAGVTVALVFAIFFTCIPFGKKIGALSKSYQDALGEAQTRSTEALGSMRTVQSFAAENRECERYREAIGDPDEFRWWLPRPSSKKGAKENPKQQTKKTATTYSVGFSKSIWTSAFYVFLFGFGFGSMYIALWYGFKLVVDANISLGNLTAFQSYIFQIGGSLGGVSRFVTQFIEARGASGRIFHLLERVPVIPFPWKGGTNCKDADGKDDDFRDEEDVEDGRVTSSVIEIPSRYPIKPKSMEGEVRFCNVDFTYPSRPDVPVLTGFSLRVPPNTACAFVGSSGAGKSTAVALLQRFYDVSGGSIEIDGNDIRSLDLKWMRMHIGYVQQEPQLFGITVRENVTYGIERDVSDREIEAVCREANALDFVEEWPEKFDTMVGERGVKLSGGQKQRLAIARALLVNPRILLLDEATSALDAESEHLVQSAIDNAMVGRTVIIVAHRLSTIMDADQIVVLDGQQIAGVGTHKTLLRQCSKYQDLIRRQTASGSEKEEAVRGSSIVSEQMATIPSDEEE